MPGDELHLKRLQYNCSVTLERFIEVARETCAMAGMLRKLPVSTDRRLAIYLQKKREDEALAGYRKASQALLNALEIHPDLPDPAPAANPLPVAKSRGARLKMRRSGNGNGQVHTGPSN